ncbi:hypothetical protein [Sphingomonas metalli]|nr:hypothetical protein [Sphingomonas metalli]
MGTAKPLASLSSGLLARKGQARPAMRPQSFVDLSGGGLASPSQLEDLGWNDMGWGETPAVPPVVATRERLRERLELTPEPRSSAEPIRAPEPAPAAPVSAISAATAARIGRESAAQTARGKAAFTLRLDADRHLRLRLASAVAGQSAQLLLTDALDAFLATMPAVEQLAGQLPKANRRSRR